MVEPEKDFAIHYQNSPSSAKHIKAIADAMKQSEELILATDPDREGEAISWHVLEVLKAKRLIKKSTAVKRISFNSITKSAVLDAIKNPREVDTSLINAQQARRALDYLVGFTLSPVLWRKLPGSRSAGRVQSVALRLIAEREEQIEKFTSEEYWSIKAEMRNHEDKPFMATLTHLDNVKLKKFDINNQEKANRAEAEILQRKENFAIQSITEKQVKRQPKPPFTTSTLQQEASRKLGFSAKKTMTVAQKLYEGVNIGGETTGLITYMRTDGVDVAKEAVLAARNVIESKYGKDYVPKSARVYKSKAKNTQEAHEAIRPTEISRLPSEVRSYLDSEQLKLYELIWKRMLASQMESAVLNQTAADIVSRDGSITFRATGSVVAFAGFYILYRESIDDANSNVNEEDGGAILPMLQKDAAVPIDKILPSQHFTQPPPRYGEASLVKKLEELGIGRPSTYAAILSVLQERSYVKLEQRRFHPEARGRIVTAFLREFFEKYVEYDFTAKLEEDLDEISAGRLDWKVFLRDFWKPFKNNVDAALELKIENVITELNQQLNNFLFPGDGAIEERRKCPEDGDDGGKLSLKLGKFGAFLGCSNYPACKYTRQLSGDAEENSELAEESNITNDSGIEFPKLLGKHPNGKDITLRKGPYGIYLQLGEEEGKGKNKVKPKRAALKKEQDPANIDVKTAITLLALPRELGEHPETKQMITAAIGRYGPYVAHNKKFTSIKEPDNPYNITLERAIEVIKQTEEEKAKKATKGTGRKKGTSSKKKKTP
jgi:DNA topoisomerase-1